ncbi:MAG: bamB [Rhodospirillales bacterium]|nr:bamB [Rhodospirillales bacterium]
MNRRMRSLLLLAPMLGLIGCSWFEVDKPKLPGERISVLSLDTQLKPDPTIAELEVQLPRPAVNPDWPQAGGYANHAMQHVALGDKLGTVWRTSAGEGSSRYRRILAQPVTSGDRIFTMDAKFIVEAFDRKTGKRLWQVDVTPKGAGLAIGGGIAVAGDRLYVSSGYAQVLALDAASGLEIWRQTTLAPVRSSPTVSDGRVFVVTVDNELNALAADDGRKLWTHTGTAETAGLVGGASPAVEGDVVVVPYSSGEIYALRVENGRQLWSESLTTARPSDALAGLADIRGRPVIDRGRVIAISHSGRMAAVDLRSGTRIWEQDIGGTETPWVAGDFIYVISNEQSLICLTRRDGRVRWVRDLPRYENVEKKKNPMTWSGPVLGGDRLIVVASNGEAMSYSPYNGAPLGRLDLKASTFVTPVIADQTLYLLTDDADLLAMR